MSDELETLTRPFLESDLSREVASVFFDHIDAGTGAATAAVVEAFRDLLADTNEGPVIFMALAALQVRRRRVLVPVRDAVLSMIDTGDADRAWRSPDWQLRSQRKTALAQLVDALNQTPVEV